MPWVPEPVKFSERINAKQGHKTKLLPNSDASVALHILVSTDQPSKGNSDEHHDHPERERP
jgi:hypothetical protein